jgi:hypothetical protein
MLSYVMNFVLILPNVTLGHGACLQYIQNLLPNNHVNMLFVLLPFLFTVVVITAFAS